MRMPRNHPFPAAHQQKPTVPQIPMRRLRPPSLAVGRGGSRFIQELRLSRSIAGPVIVAIFNIVAGDTRRQRPTGASDEDLTAKCGRQYTTEAPRDRKSVV